MVLKKMFTVNDIVFVEFEGKHIGIIRAIRTDVVDANKIVYDVHIPCLDRTISSFTEEKLQTANTLQSVRKLLTQGEQQNV